MLCGNDLEAPRASLSLYCLPGSSINSDDVENMGEFVQQQRHVIPGDDGNRKSYNNELAMVKQELPSANDDDNEISPDVR